ncbi:hypothetical protein SAMN05421786_106215 [Chryseobacterium ureilyticum]|uniref:Lipocalin-like domain-containing protein n=1 Tax=Chryseobacterium ureilyticum TaxID=373668 RepID=A0A1N7PV00_9FLAO|nr:hypothetical protein [Chryseobacterium ureilyticum]SIT14380.1 hypothetical protein SAMN05421786_106215 [Chryseobacterium ureilyticum]
MKKLIPFLLLLFFAVGFMKSQDRTSNPLLMQNWKLKKLDTYIYTYEVQGSFDTKTPGIKFNKNGKVTGNLSKSTNGYDIKTDLPNRSSKPERYLGSWKKVSDSTVAIAFSSNTSMTGTFIISKLSSHELKLKKVFSADIEKKLDSIRRTKDISY